jgi:hypothetical protein
MIPESKGSDPCEKLFQEVKAPLNEPEKIRSVSTMQNFGTWPMNEPRRFWHLERTEEATNNL